MAKVLVIDDQKSVLEMAKILIIEDDADVRSLIQCLLERAGYDVLVAEDGIEGMEVFVNGSPDIVITDLYMPRLKGIDAIKRMRDINADTKIIAISGGGSCSPKSLLRHARGVGAAATLSKPFDPSALLDAVNRLT